MSTLRANTLKPITSGNSLVLQGDSGGSGVSGPSIDSNGDVDFTQNTNAKIKLPSAGGIYESDGSTQVLTESGGSVTIQNATFNGTIGTSASGFGLVTHADQWRLSADVTAEGTITTNLEQVDTDSFSPIGSSMTQSSGIFQFPTTGTWWIGAVGAMFTTSATSFAGIYIQTNISGSSNNRTVVLGNGDGGSYYIGTFSNLIFNVTNTSTHKVSFLFNATGTPPSTTAVALGDTNENRTHFTFIRLGDT